MKKLCLWITAVLLCVSVGSASAAGSMSREQFDMVSLQIIQGDEAGNYHWEEPVTRAEFAATIVRLCQYDGIVSSVGGGTIFTDVAEEAWYAPYINTVVHTGLMGGNGDGTFRPEEFVTGTEAVKTVVICLGYDVRAQAKGGYPTGYMTTAGEIGLLRGVSLSEPFTRGALATLLYRALDIDMLQPVGGGQYEVMEGVTLRANLTGDGTLEGEPFYEKGIVTATYYSYLNAPVASIQQDEMQLNGEIYHTNQLDTTAYLGQEVELYGTVDAAGRKYIRSIQPTKDSHVLVLQPDDIIALDLQHVEYMDQGRKTKAIMDNDVKVLFNGTLCSEIDSNVFDINRGTVSFIDNNGDDVFDVLLAEEFTDVRVDMVLQRGLRLAGQHRIQGSNVITVDLQDNTKKYRIADETGKTIALDDIQTDDIVSVAINEYNDLYHMVVCRNSVQGTVDQVEENTVTIDGQEYAYHMEDTSLLEPGNQIKAYLSFRGDVVDVSQSQSVKQYGYITQVSTGNGMENVQVKVLLPGVLKEQQEDAQEETDNPNAEKIAVLNAKNKAVEVMQLASKVNVDGQSVGAQAAATQILDKLVCFETNGDGYIRRIEFPEKIGTAVKKVYNTYERTFGKTSGGAFGVSESTQVICVPKEDNGRELRTEDYLVGVQMNHGQTYDVEGFDWNPETKRADIIVIKASMNADSAPNITRRDPIGMITKVSAITREDGDASYRFTLLTDGGELVCDVAQGVQDTSRFGQYQVGDLIQYSLDSEGGMEGMNLIQSFDTTLINDWTDEYGEQERFIGYITQVQPDVVSERLNKFVYQVDVSLTEGSQIADTTYSIAMTGTPPIFIYDPYSKEARPGTLDDLCGTYSRIFVDSASMTVKSVVLIDE